MTNFGLDNQTADENAYSCNQTTVYNSHCDSEPLADLSY